MAYRRAASGQVGDHVEEQQARAATSRTLLVVDDPDAVFGSAVTAGAAPAAQPGNEHGWRVARITDSFGHHWKSPGR